MLAPTTKPREPQSMPHIHSADPRQTPFCRALIALALTPDDGAHAFARRILARRIAAKE